MHSPRRTSASASRTSSASRRLLPTTDSPASSTTPAVPVRARSSAPRTVASSDARPMKLGLETLLATIAVSLAPALSGAELPQPLELLPVPRDAPLAVGGQLDPRVGLLAHEAL